MEQRNLLIAIVLSVGILIAFQFAFERLRPPQPPGPTGGTSVTGPATSGPAPQSTTPSSTTRTNTTGANAPGAAPAQAAEGREVALAEQPRVKIETPRLHGSIDLMGSRLDDLTLATYHETVDPKSPEVVLLQPTGTADAYFAQFGWVGASDVKLPSADTKWTASADKLVPGHPLTLKWDNGEGLTFTRTISRDKNYMFTIEDAVKNTGSTPVKLTPYG